MEPPPTRPRRARAGVVAVIAAGAVLLTSCVPDPPTPLGPSPDPPPEPSVSPTTEPVPVEPLYEVLDEGLCDDARLHDIPSTFQLYSPDDEPRGRYSFVPGQAGKVKATVADCELVAHGFRDPEMHSAWFEGGGTVKVFTYTHAPHARDWYEEETSRIPPGGHSHTVEEIHGWWDAGRSVQWRDTRPIYLKTQIKIEIKLYHANLYLQLGITGAVNEDDAEKAEPLVRDIAWAMLEETIRHVPVIDDE